MMVAALFKREIKANYKLFIIFIGVLTLYAWMIISMFDPELGKSLEEMAKSMPQLFSAFGMAESGTTLAQFLVNYLYGFLLIVFPAVFIILLANKLMARYIDRGSMAYLLATPHKRSKIAFTQAFLLIISVLCLVLYVTILCIVIGEVTFPGELDIKNFIIINVALYGLLIFFSGICFCASCVFNEGKLSYGVGGGLIIAFILIQMVSQAGDKFEKLKYLTPITLFNTDGILSGEVSAFPMFIVLYMGGIILFGIGILLFGKRDLAL